MELHITKYGAKIRVKDGIFVVRYFDKKQQLQKESFAPSVLKSIWIYYPVSLSVAVLGLAQQHKINVIFVGEKNQLIGRFHSSQPTSTSKVQRAQTLAAIQPELSYSFIEKWIKEKIENQRKLLEQLLHRRTKDDDLQILNKSIASIKKLESKIPLLDSIPVSDKKQTLRGIEGATTRTFFYALNALLPKRYQFKKRSRRPAHDAFNAYLNYAFALLYNRVEFALVGVGINPYLGFMHRDGYQLKSMVHDFIEPFRAGTIWVVFQLFAREKVSLNKHIKTLENEILITLEGRKKLIEAWNKFYNNQHIKWNNIQVIRTEMIKQQAQFFANELISVFEKFIPLKKE